MLGRLAATAHRRARTARAVTLGVLGGPARARVVLLLAGVLGLSSADFGTVSAAAGNLETAFRVGNTQVGMLISVVALVTALGTVPIGVLTDRTRRTRLLAVSIVIWSVTLLLSGIARSYLWLLLTRLALGAASATTGPTVASLVGDFFPAAERSRIYGLILGGELAGAGFGFVVSGELSRAADDRGAQPREHLVVDTDPVGWSLWAAVRYVLRTPTNMIIIVASTLGYFYFAGLRSFAIIFLTGHYGLSKPVASVLVLVIGAGAIGGVFAGGRIADRALRRGRLNARVLIPAICLLALVPVLAPAIVTTSVFVALPLLAFGAALLGAPNPAMDAARLDIILPGLWGRAEAVRTVLRSLGEAVAPVLFGFLSGQVFGGPHAAGLRDTFLVCLVALVAAGALALPALRTYPRDVATAAASAEAIGRAAAKR